MDLRPAAFLLHRYVLRRRRLLATADHFDLRLHVRTDDVIGRHIYKYGAHEPDITDFLKRTLDVRDGDVILDVGANIGWHSLLFSRIAGPARAGIYAFEPDPENFALLRKNLALNASQHVQPVQQGVSDSPGTSDLHLFGGSNRGRHSMLPIHPGSTIEIRTTTLDEFWGQEELGDRVPRFLKMDIEGHELAALRGAAGVLARCPFVMLEYSPGYMRAGGIEPADLLDYMTALAFVPSVLRQGALAPVAREDLLAGDQHVDLFWRRDG